MIHIAVKANSPLALPSYHFVSNEIETLDYIPGSAFRGAVAYKLGEELGYDSPKFKEIFINGKVKFGNLYLLREGQAYPIPKSAKSCKYKDGFRGHGVIDFLLPTVKFMLAKDASVLPVSCPICEAPFDTFSGFYTKGGKRVEPTKRLITRTSIDERTLTAREGFLYSMEVIEEDQEFYGILDGDLLVIENGEIKYENTTILRKRETLWVGLGKTRGLGNIKITEIENLESIFPPELVLSAVEKRFSKFQEKSSPLNIKGFSITLYSDAIIMDKFMRYKSCIDEQYLREEFDLDNVKLICAFNSMRAILGWNTAWGLPKEKELAIEKGSTFFFSCAAEGKNLIGTLKRIETEGIGLRREEGFGRVFVCDPFHIENLPQDWEV
ncbi:MAG: hypothetical protein DDT22_00428 [candidate division WS2 bacterium]|nr:hypothetical protein [Candidatus Lithacetigena glycinireducens]